MKSIVVNGCIDCPFNHYEFDDFAIGDDSTNTCSLAQYLNKEEYFIASYNLHELNDCDCETGCVKCENNSESIATPTWCPLKDDDSFNISIK